MFYSKHETQLANDTNYSTPNDNKPLLLAGLSIATIVITIITIVLVLVFTGNDNRNTIITHPKTSTDVTKTTEITTTKETTKITEIETTESATEPTSTSTETSEFDFDKSLADNHYNISQTINGTVTEFEGYTLTIPQGWIVHKTIIKDNMFETYMGVTVSSLDDKAPTEYLKELCLKYNDDPSFEFGNLTTNKKTGYYMKSEFEEACSFNIYFFNATGDTVYEISILSIGKYHINLNTAKGIAASIEFK